MRAHPAFQPGPLAHHRLRPGGIVPEGRIFGARVQLGQAGERGVVVKDASAAAPATDGRLRRRVRFRRAFISPSDWLIFLT